MDEIKEYPGADSILEIFSKKENIEFAGKIYGTYEDPLFLASDVETLLNLTNIRGVLSNLEPYEKKKYRLNGRIRVFLTEAGIYRIVGSGRTEMSKIFRRYVYEVLRMLRLKGVVEKKTMDKKFERDNPALVRNAREEFRKRNQILKLKYAKLKRKFQDICIENSELEKGLKMLDLSLSKEEVIIENLRMENQYLRDLLSREKEEIYEQLYNNIAKYLRQLYVYTEEDYNEYNVPEYEKIPMRLAKKELNEYNFNLIYRLPMRSSEDYRMLVEHFGKTPVCALIELKDKHHEIILSGH